MWKRSAAFATGMILRRPLLRGYSAVFAAVLFGLIHPALAPRASGQTPPAGLLPGPMQEKARTACLGCHTAQIIVQQQLDRRVWAKEVDKMIRWGAPVAAEDRDALIDYFAQHFGPREASPGEASLPPGPGADKVRAACLGCHGAGIIVQQQLNRRGWTRELDKMIRWGAPVSAADREVILNYLATHFSPPAKTNRKEKSQEPAAAQGQRESVPLARGSRYNRSIF